MRYLLVSLALVTALSIGMAEDHLPMGDFVKQHLESIGTMQARAAAKNRVVNGTLKWQLLTGAGEYIGKQVLASEENKLFCLMELPKPNYPGEQLVTDGKKTSITVPGSGELSQLGETFRLYPEILTEGLWGGTLSTAWPLAHLDERNATLHDMGLKTVDGRELHRIDYIPKKHSEMEIQLYFEPGTFRHVTTIYYWPPYFGHPLFVLEEQFSDFTTVDNLTLPQRWTIRAWNSRYDITGTKISHNLKIDAKNFEIK
jgi:hypothetical protein